MSELSSQARLALLELANYYKTYTSLRGIAGFSINESMAFLNEDLTAEEKSSLDLNGREIGNKEFRDLLNLAAQIRLKPKTTLSPQDQILIGIFLRHIPEITPTPQPIYWQNLKQELLFAENQRLQHLIQGSTNSIQKETEGAIKIPPLSDKPIQTSKTAFAQSRPENLLFSSDQSYHLDLALEEYSQIRPRTHFKTKQEITNARSFLTMHKKTPANPAQVLNLVGKLHEGLPETASSRFYVDQLWTEYRALCASWGHPIPEGVDFSEPPIPEYWQSFRLHFLSRRELANLVEPLQAISPAQLSPKDQLEREKVLMFFKYLKKDKLNRHTFTHSEFIFVQTALTLVEKFKDLIPPPTAEIPHQPKTKSIENAHPPSATAKKGAQDKGNEADLAAENLNFSPSEPHALRLTLRQINLLQNSIQQLKDSSLGQLRQWNKFQTALGHYRNYAANPAKLLLIVAEVRRHLPEGTPLKSAIELLWTNYRALCLSWGYSIPASPPVKQFQVNPEWNSLQTLHVSESENIALSEALRHIAIHALPLQDQYEIQVDLLFLDLKTSTLRSENIDFIRSALTLIERYLAPENPARQKTTPFFERLRTQMRRTRLTGELIALNSAGALAQTSNSPSRRITAEHLRQVRDIWKDNRTAHRKQLAKEFLGLIADYLHQENPRQPRDQFWGLKFLQQLEAAESSAAGFQEVLALFPKPRQQRRERLNTLIQEGLNEPEKSIYTLKSQRKTWKANFRK